MKVAQSFEITSAGQTFGNLLQGFASDCGAAVPCAALCGHRIPEVAGNYSHFPGRGGHYPAASDAIPLLIRLEAAGKVAQPQIAGVVPHVPLITLQGVP